MHYLWTVLSNLLFVGTLLLVFANTYDSDTRKVLAAIAILYLAITHRTNVLGSQTAHAIFATISASFLLHRKAHSGDEDLTAAEHELRTQTEKLAARDIAILIDGGVGACVALAMVVVLIG